MFKFGSPLFFLLFLALLLLYFFQKKRKLHTTVGYSLLSFLNSSLGIRSKTARYGIPAIRTVTLILIILALARPQERNTQKEVLTEGIDMMIALDVSGSMRAEDFKPKNRLEVAKQVISEFIKKREWDRIGLIIFGGDAYTYCPLTLDYGVLNALLEKVNMEMAGDGTAIGMGIATALNRLKQSEAKSKLIILLTDGVNNAGAIEPLSAAKLAKDLSVKVYTIGVGKEGGAPIPIDHPVYGRVYARNPDGSLYLPDIDESQLKKIAALTGGRYFRAHNEKELHQIYQEINALEKTKIKTTQYHNITEYFPYVLWGVLIFMILEIVVSSFILVRVP